MYWVIQSNLFSEPHFDKLIEALDRLDLPYSVHKVVPFIGDLMPEVEVPEGMPVIALGAYTLAGVAQKRGWAPGAFVNENFDFQVQVKHWGDHLLNADAFVCPFADVPEQPEPFFIRPVTDSKCFAGCVTDWYEYSAWRERILRMGADNGGTLEGSTLVMICPKKTIYGEYRLWIVDGEVVTASQYKMGTLVHYDAKVDDAVIRYGRERAQEWSPHRAYVLDVADTDKGFKIVEVNCLNASGFYHADMQKLVMALENMGY